MRSRGIGHCGVQPVDHVTMQLAQANFHFRLRNLEYGFAEYPYRFGRQWVVRNRSVAAADAGGDGRSVDGHRSRIAAAVEMERRLATNSDRRVPDLLPGRIRKSHLQHAALRYQ